MFPAACGGRDTSPLRSPDRRALAALALLLAGGCQAPSPDTGPIPPASSAGPLRDVATTVPELQRALAAGSVVVVDVRPRARFDAFHIKGAIHRPLIALRHDAALEAGPVVVVDTGHGLGRLAELVTEHRRAARDVRILDGGMAAWCRAGAPVDGACREADLLEPGDLYQAAACPDRTVVVALPAGAAELTDWQAQAARWLETDVPHRTITLAWDDPTEVQGRARRAVAEAGSRHLLVVDGDGMSVARLRAALADLQVPVFFAAGGIARYAAFRSVAPAGRRLVSHGSAVAVAGATSAPRTLRGVVAPEGCGCF